MKRYKLAPLVRPDRSSLRERLTASRTAADRVFGGRSAGEVTGQPEGERLTGGASVEGGESAFRETGSAQHHGQRELNADLNRAGAEGSGRGSAETDMGRHESFDPNSAFPMPFGAIEAALSHTKPAHAEVQAKAKTRPRPPAAVSPLLASMVEEWRDLVEAINVGGRSDDEIEALVEREDALQMAIYRFPAASVSDLLAKVPVLKDELQDAVGGLHEDFEPKDCLAGAAWLGLFRDFERLANVSADATRAPLARLDSELLHLAATCEATQREYDVAMVEWRSIYERYEASRPARPDALRRRGDFKYFYGMAAGNLHSQDYYLPGEISSFFREYKPEESTVCPEWRRRQAARAKEIVEAQDAWEAECDRHAEQTGYAEIERRCDEIADRRDNLGQRVRDIKAGTVEGVTSKARIARMLGWDDFESEVLAELVSLTPANFADALASQILASWREGGALPDFDESEAGQAEFDRLSDERYALIDAAEALPATMENIVPKALAFAWIEHAALWSHERPREDYRTDGRLALDIDTAICGRLKTSFLKGAA